MFLPEDIDEAGEIRPQGVWDDMVRAGGGGAALLPAGRGVTWGRCCSKKGTFVGQVWGWSSSMFESRSLFRPSLEPEMEGHALHVSTISGFRQVAAPKLGSNRLEKLLAGQMM